MMTRVLGSKYFWRLLLISSILVFTKWFFYNKPINIETYRQIENGMSQAEAEALLGGPPGWYMSRDRDYVRGPLLPERAFTPGGFVYPDGTIMKGWAGNDGLILLWFDREGKGTAKQFVPVFSPGADPDYFSEQAVSLLRHLLN
jgi:hypothetical protein